MEEQTKFLVKTTGMLLRYDSKTGVSEILLRAIKTPKTLEGVYTIVPDGATEDPLDEGDAPVEEPTAVSYSLIEDFLDPELDAESSMAKAIADIVGIESLTFESMAPSRVYSEVNREPEERVLSLFHVIQLSEGTDYAEGKDDLVWFSAQSEEHKVVLSNKDSTIVLYRDGRSVGDAELINDHSTMIVSVM